MSHHGSLEFQLENDNEAVSLALSKSERLSLTDIAAATLGNLQDESIWEDNSVQNADANLPVLRPWEDNSVKSENMIQNTEYTYQHLTTHNEHLKRKLDDDVESEVEGVSKRYKVEPNPTPQITGHRSLPTLAITGPTRITGIKKIVPTCKQHTTDTTTSYRYILPALPVPRYSHQSQSDHSQNSILQPQQNNSQNSMLQPKPNHSQNSMLQPLPSNSHHAMLQSQQNYSKKTVLQNHGNNEMPLQLAYSSVQNSVKQSVVQGEQTQQDKLKIIDINSTHSYTTLNSTLLDNTRNPFVVVDTQNTSKDLIEMTSGKISSNQDVQFANKLQNVKINQNPLSVESSSNKIYFPWMSKPVLVDNRNNQQQQQTNDKQNTQEAEQQPGYWTKPQEPGYNVLPSTYMSQQEVSMATSRQQYGVSMATSQQHMQPTQPASVAWQPQLLSSDPNTAITRTVSSHERQYTATSQINYHPLTELLQTTATMEPASSQWQPNANYYSLELQPKSVEIKQDPSTPVGKGHMSFSKYDSPGVDSRFTESLSNLLGSPPPDSPLSKNPFLGDLQALLNRECKREIIPQSLFGMQGSNKENQETKKTNVFERERNLQERFTKLQSSHPEDVRQLSSMFRYQSALIETERFRTLHESQYPGSYRESVNHHYDNQLHKVMDRVEKSVELLENSNRENKLNKVPKLRPHLGKDAVRLMDAWYQQNQHHPYPTNAVIEMLAQAGNIGIDQVKKWFANKRNRSSNTRSLTEIAMQKRKLGQMPGQ